MCRLPTSFLLKMTYLFSIFKIWTIQSINFSHTYDKNALHDTVSILMLCAKYQEAGLCGSREKCDRDFL